MATSEIIWEGDEDVLIVLSTKGCPSCKPARKLADELAEEGVKVRIYMDDDMPTMRKYARQYRTSAVPSFIYNGKLVKGMFPEKVREMLGSD